jgi:formylglycine-generating enzyme required for sulfatase activity
VTGIGPAEARSAVGRADLLRALAVAPRDVLALDIDDTGWFGYLRRDEPVPPPVRPEPAAVPRSAAATEPATGGRLPLRMPFAFAVVRRDQRAPAEGDVEAERVTRGPLDAVAAEPQSVVRLIDYQDLVPQARLVPALRRDLGATRAGPLDVARVIEDLAAGRVRRRLPRRMLRRWHPDLVVVLDFSPRLWPYRADMHRLAARLVRHCGRSGVSLRIVDRGPFGPWSDWLAHQNRDAEDEPPERPWVMPPPGAPVLIVSDLGLLRGAGSAEAQAWARFIDALQRADVRPMALAPLGAEQLDASLAERLPVLRWSPDAPAHPARGLGQAEARPDGLDDLLAMVAAARRVDPPLLRAMRHLNPTAPLDAGLEGAVWCHDDVVAGPSASIRTDKQECHLERFRTRWPHLHARLNAMRREHHAHLPVSLAHEEALLWWDCADDSARESPEARQQAADAVAFVEQLAETVTSPPEVARAPGDWLAVAQGILRRAEGTTMPLRYRALHELAARVQMARGDEAVPGWVDPRVMASVRPKGPTVPCWLVQDAGRGWVRLLKEPPGPRQLPLSGALMVDGGGVRVSRKGAGLGRWLSVAALPADLVPLTAPAALDVETATETVEVAAVRRPRGAGGWRCRRDGLAVVSPPLAGHCGHWQGDSLQAVLRLDANPEATSWAAEGDLVVDVIGGNGAVLRFGLDARFGVFADVAVTTEHGRATQRLRWIEPGMFPMGSPDDEPERSDGEGPRHAVTITKGFWLADTACTQALWRAVMGDNPSWFKGDERPVEQVSWNDVEGFLRRLEGLLPGALADLPTEAEWEYACRAGTTTPFSFGATITTDQVNYDGNFPYAGGAKGAYRKETVPVKSLPPNPWGLYAMHGNVWEWCADGVRTYDDAPQVDPRGPEGEEAPRVRRGGSWGDYARWVRSAVRFAAPPGDASVYLGFRLCLRSIEPGPGRPTGPAERAPGRRPPVSPRDEAKPSRDSVMSRILDRLRPGRKS